MRHRSSLFLMAMVACGGLPAAAHLSPSGWEYPRSCCGNYDCARVDPPRVTPDGLVFTIRRGSHPMVRDADLTVRLAHDDPRLDASGDDRWHLCLRAWEPRVICGFRPPMGF